MSQHKPTSLPSLPDAFSRRRAIIGVVALAAAPTAALAGPRALDPADARLVQLVDEYEALETAIDALPSETPEYEAILCQLSPIENEIDETPAATMVGIMAKARACQLRSIRDYAASPIGFSIADDLVRLHAEGGVNV